MSAYRVIDKLESVVREGVWMPFGWRAVNSDRALDLIEKLRTTLPDEVNRTKRSENPDRALDLREAAIANSPDESKVKATESELIAKAQARADDIVEHAQAAARDIRKGADEYADHVLASLDTSLGKAHAAVQKGRQALATPLSPSNGKKPREMSAT